MATYVLLATYTENGLKGIKDTVKRAESVRELAKKAGLDMKETYWTLGAYDVVAVFEAPDDETMTAFSLSVAKSATSRRKRCARSRARTWPASSARWCDRRLERDRS
jgi:uncharacterized protein with GYD domain